MSLKPKYQIGQKLIYIKSSIYNGELDYISCYPIEIKGIIIYEDCVKYVNNEYIEIDEAELVPFNPNSVGGYVIDEIERNIDKCKQ